MSWDTYNKFKVEEERAGFKFNSFNSVIGKCVESNEHKDNIENFFVLLVSLAAAEKRNGLNGLKLARLVGIWAFELINPKREPPSNFDQGLSCWTLAADACYHMFLAFLRTMYPLPGEIRAVNLPKSLESLLVKETSYPPKKTDYQSRLIKVPKITLSVGRLSASPFVLLQRISKILSFERPEQFGSEDDFSTLYYLFQDINDVENRMSPESKRILEEITKENSIFSEHKLRIKDTPDLAYDVRAKTWSKFYNHAYINPVTGEPCRPLTNYAYEAHQRKMIINASMPKAERSSLPYPDSPTLSNKLLKEKPIGSYNEFNYYYEKSTHDPRYQNIESAKDRTVTSDYKATCTLSNVSIDDFFIWVWMSSLSQEQTDISKAVFGRSTVVELQVSEGEAGRRWVVVEEVMNPKPVPMKKKEKSKEAKKPAEKKGEKAEKVEKVEKEDKMPVRFKEPKPAILSPVPIHAPRVVSKSKNNTIHIHYDNIDPLVAAVAARLRVNHADHETQTDNVKSVQATTPPSKPHSISADDRNNKGTQTYNYVSAATSTEPLTPPSVPKLTTGPVLIPSASDMAEIRSIDISPGPPPLKQVQQKKPPALHFVSYDDAIPYLNISTVSEADYSVTPISSDAAAPIKDAPLTVAKKRSGQPESPPHFAESFVTSIDTSFDRRRVVSMPVIPDKIEGVDEAQRSGNLAGYRALAEDSDDDSTASKNVVRPMARSHQRSQSSMTSSHRAVSMSGPNMYQATNLSSGAREAPGALRPLPRPAQVQDEGLFDQNSDEYTPRNMPQSIAPQTRPPIRPSSPASATSTNSSSSSHLRGSGYGRKPGFMPPPLTRPDQFRRDPRDPRNPREFVGDQRVRPQQGPPVMRGGMRDPRQLPRDFQHHQQSGSEFDAGVGRGYQRPFFGNEGSNANPGIPPSNRFFHDSQSESSLPRGQQAPRAPPPPPPALPTVDDMIMDSGPMPGGARSKTIPLTKPARPNHSSGAPPFSSANRQTIPTTHHSSPDNSDKGFAGYGSDSNYRYDPSERPKASPDSGFANPPSLVNQQQQHKMQQRHYSSSSGSDIASGPLRNRQRSMSNAKGQGLPPPISMGSSQLDIVNQPQQVPQVRHVAEIKAPQPRSSVAPQLFAETPLKSVSKSVSTIREPTAAQRINSTVASVVSGSSSEQLSSTLPRQSEAIIAPPVVSAIHASSEPGSGHSYLGSGSTMFEDRGFQDSGSNKTQPISIPKLAAVLENHPDSAQTLASRSAPVPVAHAPLNRQLSDAGASSRYTDERSTESPSSAHEFTTGFVPSEAQTRELFARSPQHAALQQHRRGVSVSSSPNFPDPSKFDPLNEQSIMRATKLNLLRPDPMPEHKFKDPVAAPAEAEDTKSALASSSGSKRVSRFSMAGFLEARKAKGKK